MGFIEGTACVKNVSSGFSLFGSNVANPSTFFTVLEGQLVSIRRTSSNILHGHGY